MNVLHAILRLLIVIPASFLGWMIFFFAIGLSFGLSVAIALCEGVLLYYGLLWYSNHSFLKKHQLTYREYLYIRDNLRDAKEKIRRVRRTFFQARSMRTFNQMTRIHRLMKQIYSIVKKEPRRFYQAERFFFYHLDSVVELAERHAFLANQPVKSIGLEQSLRETRRTIDQLIQSVEQDLHDLLSTDREHLAFELDVAKQSLKKWVTPIVNDGRSSKNE